jgi:hypothetical protein
MIVPPHGCSFQLKTKARLATIESTAKSQVIIATTRSVAALSA